MDEAMQGACRAATHLLDEYAPVEIPCRRYAERAPHPGGQEAFTIRARFPWHREPSTRVMIEISVDEKVIKSTPRWSVIHGYDEKFNTQVLVYAMEEIVAEKLRAILQHAEKLEQRGWSRSRARDYYDLWRIFNTYKDQLELADFATLLRRKCAARNVSFNGAADFFPDKMLVYVEKTWRQWLGPLVPDLPAYGSVIDALRPQVEILLPSS